MRKSQYVITITREFGSLGRPIAKRLSEILDIEYYDRDLVDQAAEKLHLPKSIIDEAEESAISVPTTFFRMQFPLGKGTNKRQDEIFEAQQNIIKFLADKETCVIVGRCSDFILSEMKNALHIYLYAPYKNRVENCVNDLGLKEEDAKKMIVAVDEARNSYHMNYAGYYPDDKKYKNLLVDSSVLGVEGTAQFLADYVRRCFDIKTN